MKPQAYIAFLSLVFLGLTTSSFAQKEANWWYFGHKAGIDFNTNPPTAYSNGGLNTDDGTATISDKHTGRLLFYHDGNRIFNSGHGVMPNTNSLPRSGGSVDQPTIIVPNPGNVNQYYVFVASLQSPYGPKYGIVDMTLSGVLGNVVIGSARNLDTLPVSEKVSAQLHSNGQSYWVMFQDRKNLKFYAYHVTATGVSTVPVVSTVLNPNVNHMVGEGCMKFSPNGEKLAATIRNRVYLFDFDDSTGRLSNPIDFGMSGFPHGVEFSPNSKLLYVTNQDSVLQYDISSGSPSSIFNSKYVVRQLYNGWGHEEQIQLGPNLKIYIANRRHPNHQYLSVINNPNVPGAGCNYQLKGINIPSPARSYDGLPNFVSSFFNRARIDVKNQWCYPDQVVLNLQNKEIVDSVYYDFGDTNSTPFRYSRNFLDSHNYSAPGRYPITAYVWYKNDYRNGTKDTLTDTIEIILPPKVSLGNDTMVCKNGKIEAQISNGAKEFSFIWPDSSTNNTYQIDSAGEYWVTAINRCGTFTDTVRIDSIYPQTLYLGNDTTICSSDSVILRAHGYQASFIWHDSSTVDTFVVKPANETYNALYTVHVNSTCGTWSDQINVNIRTPPLVNLGPDTALCSSYGQYFLNPGFSRLNTYLWNTGSSWYGRYLSQSDTTWVSVTNNCGTTTDTVIVQYDDSLKSNFYSDTLICHGDQFVLLGNPAARSFHWFNGDTAEQTTITSGGVKWVKASNACNELTDSMIVGIEHIPSVKLPNDTAFCAGPQLQLNVGQPRSTYLWNNGSVDSVRVANATGMYAVTVSNKCGSTSDSLRLVVDSTLHLALGPDTLICPGTQLYLSTNKPIGTLLTWFNGATTYQTSASTPGAKWLRAKNTCGVFTDTVHLGIEKYPEVNFSGDSTICHGAQVLLQAYNPRATYQWSTGSSTPDITINSQGLYRVTVSNKCGQDSGSFQLWVDSNLTINLGPDTMLCDDQELTFNLTFPNQPEYLWSNGIKDSSVSFNHSGKYSVTVTNTCGSYSDEMALSYNYTPKLHVAGFYTICEGNTLTIDAELDESIYRSTNYIWSDKQSTPRRVVESSDTTYWVEASNFCGTDRDTIALRSQALPQANLGPDTLLCDGESLLLDVTGENLSYHWQDGSNTGTFLVQEAGDYTVLVTDEYGCETHSTLAVSWCEPKIWVPSAFTPNLDGANEGFRAYSEYIYDYNMTIYDRWGQVVFEANDISHAWNGINARTGELVPAGVYTYKISYKRKDHQLRVKTGTVMLMQ